MKRKLFLGLASLLCFTTVACDDNEGSTNVSHNEKISNVRFASFDQITFRTSESISNYKVLANEDVVDSIDVTSEDKNFTYNFKSKDFVDVTNAYTVEVTFKATGNKLSSGVNVNTLYKTPDFEEKFTYDGDDLGVTYTTNKSTFKVWSPVSTSITLKVYRNGTPKSVDASIGDDTVYLERELVKGEKGVWSTEVEEDLAGMYYTFVVNNFKYKNEEVVDPYAKSAGVNGLRGMIVDFTKTNPAGWDGVTPYNYDRKSLVVYETHIADISSSKTWSNKEEDKQHAKKFKGAYLSGTTYSKGNVTVTTGFDHIKEMGVNAVQIIPIFDQTNDEVNMKFNWGYNPLNYNVLEGGYSSNPHDGYVRIKEFKELVMAYNKEGMNIIMDVVYNHVNEAIKSNFDILMPYYFYRYNSSLELSNGSGCGNETASDMPMFRKFMIDSTAFLAKEYKLGGFRFDLMALHDMETMNLLTAKLKTINEGIVVYGEPWDAGGSALAGNFAAKQNNGNNFIGYGQFNDQMRDSLIKSGMNGKTDKGWVNNTTSAASPADIAKILGGIQGFTMTGVTTGVKDPDKTVNYATCHDNYTLYDRIKASGIEDEATIKSCCMLANSVILTSQATTFMLAGEEFFRTKQGDHNSYQSSYEVNEHNYELKVDNYQAVENYKKLIALKTSVDGLALNKEGCENLEVTINGSNQIVYDIVDSKNNKTYKIIHNNGYDTFSLKTLDLTGYELYLNTDLSGDEFVISNETKFKAYQTVIVVKNN